MDGAKACDRYQTIGARVRRQWVGGRERRGEASGVSLGRTAFSADLGGSSNYSNENFEGRSGEGFRENSNWSRVTRS